MCERHDDGSLTSGQNYFDFCQTTIATFKSSNFSNAVSTKFISMSLCRKETASLHCLLPFSDHCSAS